MTCALCGKDDTETRIRMWAIMGRVVPLHDDCEPDYVTFCDDDGTLPRCAA
jgi:hypothetical protein